MSKRVYIPDPGKLRYPASQSRVMVRISPAVARFLRRLLRAR